MKKNSCLSKAKGNMYPWVDFTFNPLAGACHHNCTYCYVKKFPISQNDKYKGSIRLADNAFEGYLPEDKIFVISCNDLFGSWVKGEFIERILDYCKKYDAKYLFQSKNPNRIPDFDIPESSIVGTTIETNRLMSSISNAPSPKKRALALEHLDRKKMVSIEPIMEFDLNTMVNLIETINPTFVSIGADSKGSSLPEPEWDKVDNLIEMLKDFTEVKQKSNLERLKD